MSDSFSIEGKVIVLTGGSGFLGGQFTRHLSGCGATVVNFDQRSERPVDITRAEDVRRAAGETVGQHGRIDGLIHAAAINAAVGSPAARQSWSPYEEFPLDLWNKEIEINLTAVNIVTQAIAPIMMKQNHGSIVIIASDLALIGPNNTIYDEGCFKDLAYIASKSGLLGFMRAWASYLGKYNVRVNAAVLGGMYNGQPQSFVEKNGRLNMLGRMAKEGEYNGAMQFLLSEASSYMTGASFVIDAGRTAW